jgi:ribose transport system ATP-binding protein
VFPEHFRPTASCLHFVHGIASTFRITQSVAGRESLVEVQPSDPMPAPLLAMHGIGKTFDGVQALRDVDLTIRAGEVHALIGENGAGKSTLLNIMSGVINDYQGQVLLAGRPVRFSSPQVAQKAGVATVFQELDLVPGLSVAHNMFLGHEPRRGGLFVDNVTMHRRTAELLRRVGGRISPRTIVGSLRLGQQQAVAIAKALAAAEPRILILDEPTAALSAHEVELLFDIVRRLRTNGVGIVFISHRLEEVGQVGDRVTVLRDGQIVATLPASTPQAELVPLLTGRPTREMFPTRGPTGGPVRLRLTDFTYRLRRPTPEWQEPEAVDLTVHEGEIVGLVGLLGAGRTELLQSIYGAAPPGRRSGRVEVDGWPFRPRTRSIRSALLHGVGFVPDDRRGSGLVTTRNVTENLVLADLERLSSGGFVRRGRLLEAVRWAFTALGIKAAGGAAAILSLSGGNQQKVVIGRALLRKPRLLLLDEPTRGVDVGAKADIYHLVRSLTATGLAVIVASSELPELAGWCDRLVVLRRGRVAAEVPPDTDPAVILSLAGDDFPGDLP